MVLALMIYFVNWFTMLTSVAQQNSEGSRAQRIIAVLNAVEGVIEHDEDEEVYEFIMPYEWNEHDEDWMKKTIWDRFVHLMVDIMKNVTISSVSNADVEDSVPVIPRRGAERKLLKAGYQVSAMRLWYNIFGKTDHSKTLGAELVHMIWKVLLKRNLATEQMAYDNSHQVDITIMTAIGNFIKRMLDAIKSNSTEGFIPDDYLSGDKFDEDRFVATAVQHYHSKVAPENYRQNGEQDSAIHCYSCEQVWPESLNWPPPREKVVGNVRVTIQENESNADVVAGAENTRSHAAINHPDVSQPTSSSAQSSIFDRFLNTEGVTFQDRQGALAEIMHTIFSKVQDDIGFLNSLDMMVATQRQILAEEQRLHQEQEARAEQQRRQNQQRRERQQASKRREAEEERARKALVVQRKQEEKQQKAVKLNASITGRNRTIPPDPLVDEIQDSRRAESVQVPEAPPLPDPPRPSPVGPSNAPPVFVPIPPPINDDNPLGKRIAEDVPPAPPIPDHLQPQHNDRVLRIQPPPPVTRDRRLAMVHNWVPSKMGKVSLNNIINLDQILVNWSTDGLFEKPVENLQNYWSSFITCQNEFDHDYIRAQPITYHKLQDYVFIWRAVISNEIFHELYKIVDNETLWRNTDAPPGMIVNTGPGTGGNRQHHYGNNAYLLHTPFADLSTSSKISLFQAFNGDPDQFSLLNLPLRSWDVVILRTYRHDGDELSHTGTFLVVLSVIYLVGDGLIGNGRSVSYDGIILARDITSFVGSNRKTLRSDGSIVCSMDVVGYLGNHNRSLNSLVVLSTFGDPEIKSLLLGRPRLDINMNYYEPTIRSFKVAMIDTGSNNLQDPPTSDDVLIDVTALGQFGTCFMRYVTTFYEQHIQETAERSSTVARQFRSLNRSQALAVAMMITAAGVETDNSIIRRRMSGLVGPAGTGKTRTLVHAIGAVIANVHAVTTSVLDMERLRRIWEANPTKENEVALFNYRPRRPVRILILTPTNNSLDVIEDMILDGIPVLDVRRNEWIRCHVFYKRTGNFQTNLTSSVVGRRIRARRTRIFPEGFHQSYNHGLVLSTCASSYQAFPCPQESVVRRNNDFTRFSHVFVDEASQISDDDFFVPLAGIRQTMETYGDWPFISIIADNEQKTKFSHATPSPYYYTLKCSLFDRFLPQTSRLVPGKNNFRCIQLDTQYRMHPMISNLANSITRRTVRTSLTPGHDWKSSSYDNCQLYYSGSLRDLTPSTLRPAVMWFDPYVNENNTRDDITAWLRNSVLEDDGFEQSPEEAAFVVQLFRLLVDSVGINFSDILILTTYNRQRRLVESALQEFIPDTFGGDDGLQRVRQVVTTVGSVEGNEAWAVIYTSGRSPQDQRHIGENSLIDDHRDIHVITTRAKRHIFYVGNLDFFSTACTNWSAITDLVTPRTAN